MELLTENKNDCFEKTFISYQILISEKAIYPYIIILNTIFL